MKAIHTTIQIIRIIRGGETGTNSEHDVNLLIVIFIMLNLITLISSVICYYIKKHSNIYCLEDSFFYWVIRPMLLFLTFISYIIMMYYLCSLITNRFL